VRYKVRFKSRPGHFFALGYLNEHASAFLDWNAKPAWLYRDFMLSRKDISPHRDRIEKIADKYGILSIQLFGSVARGNADDLSDVDLLVSTKEGTSLLSLGGFQVEVERLLGRTVDVVTLEGLRPKVKERALQEAVAL
jgi:predicted nucleotidyltransferase